jgi:hypothetical protein
MPREMAAENLLIVAATETVTDDDCADLAAALEKVLA